MHALDILEASACLWMTEALKKQEIAVKPHNGTLPQLDVVLCQDLETEEEKF